MNLGRLEISRSEKDALYSEIVNVHLYSIPTESREELTIAIANLWALANWQNHPLQPQRDQQRVVRARTAEPNRQKKDDASDQAPSLLPHRKRNGLEQSLLGMDNQPIKTLKDVLDFPAKYVPDHFEEFRQYVLDRIRRMGSELTARKEAEDHAVIQLFDTVALPEKPSFDGMSSQEKAFSCRRWLQEHADRLNAVKDIDLSNKRLGLVPKEIELFSNLQGLNLSNNGIETLNGIPLPVSLQRLTLADNPVETLEPLYKELRLWENDYAEQFHSPCIESLRPLFALEGPDKRLLGQFLAKIRETQEYRSGGSSKAAFVSRIGTMLHRASTSFQSMNSLKAEAQLHVQLWAWNADHLEFFHSPCVESFDLLFSLDYPDMMLLGQYLAKIREKQEYRNSDSRAALVGRVGNRLHQASINLQGRGSLMAEALMCMQLQEWNTEYQEIFHSPCLEGFGLLTALKDYDKMLLGQFLAKVRETQEYRSGGNSRTDLVRLVGNKLHYASINLLGRSSQLAEAMMYVQLWAWNDEHRRLFRSPCVEDFHQLSTLKDYDKWLLGQYIIRIRKTHEYARGGESRTDLVRRIGDMLHQASTNPQARDCMTAKTQLYVRLQAWNDEYLAFFRSPCMENTHLLYALGDPDKRLLGQYLAKIYETKDYTSGGASRVNLVRRVGTVLRLTSTNLQFRDQMVAAISEGVGACGDRTISVFNDIEILWKSYQENMTEEQVRVLAIGQGRYELIKKIARRMVQERNLPTRNEAETILFFHLSLQRLFDLPFSAQGMLYPQLSNVTDEMVVEMTAEVSQVSDEDLLEESPIWERWQHEHLQPEVERIAVRYNDLVDQAKEYYDCEPAKRQEYLTGHEELSGILQSLEPLHNNYDAACTLISQARKKAIATAGHST